MSKIDIAETLRSWTIDWNGAPMVDGEPPRDGLHCKILRDAADEIVRLRAEVELLKRRPAASDIDPTAGLDPIFNWDGNG